MPNLVVLAIVVTRTCVLHYYYYYNYYYDGHYLHSGIFFKVLLSGNCESEVFLIGVPENLMFIMCDRIAT